MQLQFSLQAECSTLGGGRRRAGGLRWAALLGYLVAKPGPWTFMRHLGQFGERERDDGRVLLKANF